MLLITPSSKVRIMQANKLHMTQTIHIRQADTFHITQAQELHIHITEARKLTDWSCIALHTRGWSCIALYTYSCVCPSMIGPGDVPQRWRHLASLLLAQSKYIRLSIRQRRKLSPASQEAVRGRLRTIEQLSTYDLLDWRAAIESDSD